MEQLHLVRRHGQQRHNDRQWQGPPEPSGEVLELRIFLLFQLGDYRFQGHAADRTAARARLADLRVHRTGIFSNACTCRRRDGRLTMVGMLVARMRMGASRAGVSRRFRLEAGQALLAAEAIGLPLVLLAKATVRRHCHAAHRIALTSIRLLMLV
ncbi:hypothetical protein FQZ97_649420 [compost metagenome]